MKKVTADIVHIVPGLEIIEEAGILRASLITRMLEWYNGSEWIIISLGEAPTTGLIYGRVDGEWIEIQATGQDIQNHITDNQLHLSANEKSALVASNDPTGLNALITANDLSDMILNGGYF